MSNSRQLLQIRNKKLGLLMLNARETTRRSLAECAEATGVSPEQFQAFENGENAPSLPQLELLSLFLNVPIEHFFGRHVLPDTGVGEVLQEKDRLMQLRSRVIGTNLRLARNTMGLSYKEITHKTGIPEEQLKRYEMGELAVPIPELELLAVALEMPIERFYDQHGPIGKWRTQQGSVQKFLELPVELQQFLTKPVNRPYLDLAMRLSDLSAEKLRAVAEVLLEITY